MDALENKMIHPAAIKAFLYEKRDNHDWMKKLTNDQLDAALRENKFKTICPDRPLDKHQKVCILLGIAYQTFCYWLDMGTGKSRIVLELINHFWRRGLLKRAIILAISDEAVSGWADEIEEWGFKVPFMAVGTSSVEEKWKAVAELGAGLVIMTYPGYNWMFSDKKLVKRKKKVQKKGKTFYKTVSKPKLVPNMPRIKRFGKGLDAFILDESVHLGSHDNIGFRIARKMTKETPFRYALAGVPVGRDPTLLWSQYFLIDRGETLGETLGIFRAAFFDEKQNYFSKMPEYTYRKEMDDELYRLMKHRSISYDIKECAILPPCKHRIRQIELTHQSRTYFDNYMEELRKAGGNKQKRNNIFLRMRQLASGFIGYKNDETGARAQLILPDNPKLDRLIVDIAKVRPDRRIIIFHEFTISGKIITDKLRSLGYAVGWIYGGEKNGSAILKRFKKGKIEDLRILVVNHFKGAESLNLQRANHCFVYESPVGVIKRKQMERRFWRRGQQRKCFLTDYVATETDRRILEFHAEGADLFAALLRGEDRRGQGFLRRQALTRSKERQRAGRAEGREERRDRREAA